MADTPKGPKQGSESPANSRQSDNFLTGFRIGCVVFDAELCLLRATPTVQQQFGLRAVDIGLPVSEVVGEFSTTVSAQLQSAAAQVLETGEGADVLMLSAGDRRDLIKLAPLTDEQGNVDGLIMNFVDVAAFKQIEADLLRSNEELSQFAYLTSHDLQEPLRSVSNFAEVLETRYGDRLDDDGRQYLGIVLQSTARMQQLIQGVLDYSRIGRSDSRTTAVKEMVDLDAVVEAVVYDLDSAIKQSRAVVKLQPLPKIVGFESELRILFSNLVANAIKFRKRDVTPEVRIEANRQRSGCWRFTVTDNGIGIPAGEQQQIFEMFNRLHTKDEVEGAGIGLAQVRKIVELHNGQLWVHSEPGVGSAFSFELRLV